VSQRSAVMVVCSFSVVSGGHCRCTVVDRGVFRPRQTRQLPRAADLKGRLLSCQSY
jgi:hypothetical protein